ncbi:MAG: SHOCT domain-containing protein [Actinomycetia bacterium]|nr:SHOCT domain-containing protein [Actinomycetes bacterium]
MPRRRGRPGLVGTMARTAVVAGTATAVHGSMTNKSNAKAADAQAQADANQTAYESQAQLAAMQQEMAAMKAQNAAAATPAPAPAAAPAAGDDMMAKLAQLADMKAAGILSDEEFAAAKMKILS